MRKQNYVYVILENWKRKSGENGVTVNIFITYDKMEEYYRKLKEIYIIDYSDNDNMIFDENIDDENKNIKYSAYDEYGSDKFEINCYRKEIKN